MKIYTRTGDAGNTQVYASQTLRVSKDDILLATYGDIDELNSHLGMLVCLLGEHGERPFLENIQRTLFQAGFAISASSTLTSDDVAKLEKAIDAHTAILPPQTQFLLPGGCQAASQCHIARTVCRRAERTVIRLAGQHAVPDAVMAYLNRLSDYLYTLARTLNAEAGIAPPAV